MLKMPPRTQRASPEASIFNIRLNTSLYLSFHNKLFEKQTCSDEKSHDESLQEYCCHFAIFGITESVKRCKCAQKIARAAFL